MIFFLYFIKNELPYHRFAISINKRIAKAIQRNYMKRVMKEMFRINQFRISKRYDLWMIIKKDFNFDDSHLAKKHFQDALEKIAHHND